MKTHVITTLLAVFCLFSSHAFGQKGSIQKLLEQNGYKWNASEIADPSDFDNEGDLGAETEVRKLTREEGEVVTMTTVVNLISGRNLTALSLKESLQHRKRTYVPDIMDVYYGKTVVFLGSSVKVKGKTYYPILRCQKGSKKGVVEMTDNPFCQKEAVDIVVKY